MLNAKRVFVVVTLLWLGAALAHFVLTRRGITLVAAPISVALWYSAHSIRLRQSTQLVMPVLLLPGALMCFVGMMQTFGYGRMSDEPIVVVDGLRATFFTTGLALHFAAFALLAMEPRASDYKGEAEPNR